ncbi:hypothetical protein D3C81_1881940 [compost metagenome]
MSKQPLQQTRSILLGRGLKLAQRFALQTTQLTEQQWNLTRLTHSGIQLFGKTLERPAHFPWQR